jgi:mannose-6-phosphate isomerase-like protein (cupin superfamily)
MSKTIVQRKENIKKEFNNGLARMEILVNTYDQAKFYHCTMKAGATWEPKQYTEEDKCQIFLFTNGTGYIAMDKVAHNITETAVFVPNFDKDKFVFHAGTDMEFVQIICIMGEYDKIAFAESTLTLPRFRLLSDCWTYEERFKGPGVKSYMMIEHRNLGRFSMGATIGYGPSYVGEHVHPDLEQWYMVLPGSGFTYLSDGEEIPMSGGDISFTSHGAYHGCKAKTGQKFDYVWFELCEDGYIGELPEDLWPIKK